MSSPAQALAPGASERADALRALRNHGQRAGGFVVAAGNQRMTERAAAMGLALVSALAVVVTPVVVVDEVLPPAVVAVAPVVQLSAQLPPSSRQPLRRSAARGIAARGIAARREGSRARIAMAEETTIANHA